MASPCKDSPTIGPFQLGFSALPQYGFGPDLTFDSLVAHNPFVFRVYTPRQITPFFDNSEPFFIGQKFKNNYRYSVQDFELLSPGASTGMGGSMKGSCEYQYKDVATHMDWTKKNDSPFVTTSFSFAWALFEATKRFGETMKDVEIAVIDARAVAGRAVTALELLRKGSPKERHVDHWKWYRYATEAQDVLVYGYIPGSAVLSSIPITSLLPRLPSYFLRSEDAFDDGTKPTVFSALAWETTRPSYQHFCQQLSDAFLRLPPDIRLRDTTASSVRLALGFLRPYFQRRVMKDFQEAVDTVAELAYIIARWPGMWWVREHGEIWDLIEEMVRVVGEETREAQRDHAYQEVMRLQDVVSELQVLTDEVVSVHSRPVSMIGDDFMTLSKLSRTNTDPDLGRSLELLSEKPQPHRSLSTPAPVPPSPPAPVSVPLPIIIHPPIDEKPLVPAVTYTSVSIQTQTEETADDMVVTVGTGVVSGEEEEQSLAQALRALAPSASEIASCVVTSFLFGAWSAMFLIGCQRREFSNHFT